ncbi:MAG: hypothetical protein J0L64_24540, partial [Acidobacteria bacterium]|nr:hypothetical protein [Acidobacteriota bacterium]
MARLSALLPWLTVRGRYLTIPANGQSLLLRGVNRSGLEYSEPGDDGFLFAASLSPREFQRYALDWRCDLVRIPFNQDWALMCLRVVTGRRANGCGFALPGWLLVAGLRALQVAFQRGGTDLQ